MLPEKPAGRAGFRRIGDIGGLDPEHGHVRGQLRIAPGGRSDCREIQRPLVCGGSKVAAKVIPGVERVGRRGQRIKDRPLVGC